GQCSGRYGKIEDMVVSLDGVLGTGEPFTMGVPGPGEVDARALFTGSEGLYGFVTRAALRVWPAPTTRAFASFSFPTVKSGWSAIQGIYQAGLRPAVTRLYDPFDSFLARQGGGRAHGRKDAGRKHPLSGL